MGGRGGVRREMVGTPAMLVVYLVCAAALGIVRAQPTELNGKYEFNDSIIPAAFPLQSRICTDELLLDAANGTTVMLPSTAFIFEDGDDPCGDTASFLFDEYDRDFRFSAEINEPGLATFEFVINAESGFLARMPADEFMACGPRTLNAFDVPETNMTSAQTLRAGFVYLESGLIRFTGTVLDQDLPTQEINMEDPSLIYFGAVSLTGEDSSPMVPSFCAFTKLDDSVCFPASGAVTLENGESKNMALLELGDRVRVATNPDVFSDVFFFGHREPRAVSHFLRFSLASGNQVSVSPRHYIYSQNRGRTLAKHVLPGKDALQAADGQWDPVVARHAVFDRGVFSPHTLQGDLLVDGYLVSSYSDSVSPGLAHILLAPLRLVYRTCGARPLSLFSVLEGSVRWPTTWVKALRRLSAALNG
ncbi:Desert hedgehog protein A [Porphyridium purpureum]|uniref:Desert hedgehog protein A n=1 Tax=Porphyridium purpureum TaxID=35688 RepID=A0A5J4YMS1_PORPP|nr:Desert hedgehog protein A [Porphyridium purpureum]|eukprot:POR7728..scf295_9